MPEPRRRGRPAGRRSNGEGSIYWDESRKLYRGALTVGLSAAGKPIRKRVSGKTRREASDRLDELRGRAEDLDMADRVYTVAEWAALWLDTINAQREVSTAATVRDEVERHIIGHRIGRHRLDMLREHHVDAWLRERAELGLRGPTVQNHRKHLDQIMQWAVARRRGVRVNPVKGAVTPRQMIEPSDPKRSLTAAQAQALAAVCATDKKWGAYFLLGLLMGLRPGEIAALRSSAVNVDARTVHVGWALKRAHGAPVAIGPTKTEHTRTVAMHSAAAAALGQHAIRPATDPRWEGLIFLTYDGVPCHQSNVRKQLRRLCRAAGVPEITPYELRHTCASLLLGAGESMTMVADMLGTSERMLRKHYHHLTDPVISAGTTAMEGIVSGVAPPVAPPDEPPDPETAI